MLKVENLFFGYDIKCCNEPLSFNADKGTFLSITGANGIGKSTLIKTILGDIRVIKGEVLFNGNNIDSISLIDRAKLISIVTSKFNTSLNLNVKDILNHAGIVNHKKGFTFTNDSFEDQIKLVLEDLGIYNLVDKEYTTLSSGQQQMVLIARAILQNTEVIILDEPTAFLDVKNKLLIFKLLRQLSKKGKLIILISHDVDLVYKYSDTILFLQKEKFKIVDKNNISLEGFYQMFSV